MPLHGRRGATNPAVPHQINRGGIFTCAGFICKIKFPKKREKFLPPRRRFPTSSRFFILSKPILKAARSYIKWKDRPRRDRFGRAVCFWCKDVVGDWTCFIRHDPGMSRTGHWLLLTVPPRCGPGRPIRPTPNRSRNRLLGIVHLGPARYWRPTFAHSTRPTRVVRHEMGRPHAAGRCW